MVDESHSDTLRRIFQHLLGGAITRGLRPTVPTVLGPQTRRAIDVVACAHPDATADHIADAYDAFSVEHGEQLTGR